MQLHSVHHIAIICSNYDRSKAFYIDVLGFKIEREVYRKERDSHKLDLSLNGTYILELFSFPNPPDRASYPEATGLRHLAFAVDDVDAWVNHLRKCNVPSEDIRIDEYTQKRFTFFCDPDGLPIELYER